MFLHCLPKGLPRTDVCTTMKILARICTSSLAQCRLTIARFLSSKLLIPLPCFEAADISTINDCVANSHINKQGYILFRSIEDMRNVLKLVFLFARNPLEFHISPLIDIKKVVVSVVLFVVDY